MIKARWFVLCLLAASTTVVSACTSHEEVSPNQLAKLMQSDDGEDLVFKRLDTKAGESGTVDLVDRGDITVSLLYQEGQAYRGDTPPHDANEILTNGNRTYSYCVSGVNRALTGDEGLAPLMMAPIHHLIVSLLHPDARSLNSFKEHLPESAMVFGNILHNEGGATVGRGYDGAENTYYIHDGWLWRWASNDNFAMLCAIPIIH